MRLGDEDDLPEGVDSEAREPQFSDDERPVDLVALRADDALVEELAAGRAARTGDPAPGSEDELVAMLAAWVAEVRPDTTTPSEARSAATGEEASDGTGEEHAEPHIAAVTPLGVPKHRAGRPRHRAARVLDDHPALVYGRRFAVAAALVVLSTSGVAIGAASAEPGEVLWPVSRVFYAERARSVEAAVEVTASLEQARSALREGRSAEARQAIATAAAHLPAVRPAEGHDDLARAQQHLLNALGGPGSANPGTTAPGTATAPGGTATPSPGPGGEGLRDSKPRPSAYAAPPKHTSDPANPRQTGTESGALVPPSASGTQEPGDTDVDESTTSSPDSGPTLGGTPSDTPDRDGGTSSEEPGNETPDDRTPDLSEEPDSSPGTGSDWPRGGEPGTEQGTDSGTPTDGDERPTSEGTSPSQPGSGSGSGSGEVPFAGNDSPSQSGSGSEPSPESESSSEQPAGQPGADAEAPSQAPAESLQSEPSTGSTEDTGGSGSQYEGGTGSGDSGSTAERSSDTGSNAKKSSDGSGNGKSGDSNSGDSKSDKSGSGDSKSGTSKPGDGKSGDGPVRSLLTSVTKAVGKITGHGN